MLLSFFKWGKFTCLFQSDNSTLTKKRKLRIDDLHVSDLLESSPAGNKAFLNWTMSFVFQEALQENLNKSDQVSQLLHI